MSKLKDALKKGVKSVTQKQKFVDRVKYPENRTLEGDAQAEVEQIREELTDVRKGIKKDEKNAAQRQDTNYYFVVYFQSEAQKMAYMKAIQAGEGNLADLGLRFINGVELAQAQGIDLEKEELYMKDFEKRVNKKFAELAGIEEEKSL